MENQETNGETNEQAKVVIKDLRVENKFRYFWLKYVTGVNLNVHCAGCLKGEYSSKIHKPEKTSLVETWSNCVLDEHDSQIFYLCGVTKKFDWWNNFHLAFQRMPGAVFTFDIHGVSGEISNAKQLEIDISSMYHVNNKNLVNEKFNSCRNWRFANYLHRFPEILKP